MIEVIIAHIDLFLNIMNKGGLSMWVLFFLNLLLWYGLGYRHLILRRRSVNNVRSLITSHLKSDSKKDCKGLLDYAIKDALIAATEAKAIGKRPRHYINDILSPYLRRIKKYAILVKTIVVLAPLIGLLGTVTGMIETFDALQNSVMFSQGNSISGGISKALFTTELGLVVAVPGLIIGRVLERKQRRFAIEFEMVTDIICTKEIVYEV
jgi:biopolymer transport protein ExbB